ncbi:MAG: hypothetical protein NT040_12535 [Bacteroidetes bacterium]|nr:hypothetical protein [Bacteroidota bacterium]
MKQFSKKIRGIGLIQLNNSFLMFCLLLIAAFYGCRKDFQFDKVKNLSWNPDFAVPLVNDTITLRKILTQGHAGDNLKIDESGDISILYYFNSDAFRLRPADLIRLSPASFAFQHQISQVEQETLGISDLILPPVTFNLPLVINNPQITVTKLTVKVGSIMVRTSHTFSNSGSLTTTFLNATKNGLPFSFKVEPFSDGPKETKIDISGVTFDLSSSPNVLSAKVEGVLKQSGEPVAGDQMRADFEVAIDTIGWFEGYLGQQTFDNLKDTVDVRVFNNAYTLGEVYFMDPQDSITIVNSIGVPAEITIEKMVAINDASGTSLDIANRLGSGSVLPVPSPLITSTLPAISTLAHTNANTGNAMNDFFNVKPDHVAFQVKTVINPAGNRNNFFSDTSSFFGDLRVKLPLWGHFDHLTFQDTFDLVINKPEELEHLEFRTDISNGLPLTALMQIYFTDENYNKKDSLAGDDMILIREAPVDPSTYLPYPDQYGVKDTTYILNTQRMLNLQNVKKMLVKAVLNSADNGHADVKLRASQALKLNFSARAKLRKTIETGK